jgi:hypothetical protein
MPEPQGLHGRAHIARMGGSEFSKIQIAPVQYSISIKKTLNFAQGLVWLEKVKDRLDDQHFQKYSSGHLVCKLRINRFVSRNV